MSIAARAGVTEMVGRRGDGSVGAMSGSCKLHKDSVDQAIVDELNRTGVAVVPIPGTRHAERLDQNVASLAVELDAEALAALQPLSDQVAGGRYGDRGVR